jgi:prepilin-type processing-associated H-X9-DG protein
MRMLASIAFVLFALSLGQAQGLPPELAAIPNDAFVVGHLQVTELWKNESLKDFRTILEKAGDEAIQRVDKRYAPTLSTVERLTFYSLVPTAKESFEPSFVFIVTLNKPLDRARWLKQVSSSLTEKAGKVSSYYVDNRDYFACCFIDTKTVAFGSEQAIVQMCNNAPKGESAIAKIVAAKSTTRPFVLGYNLEGVPKKLLESLWSEEVPLPFRPVLNVQSALLSFDLEGDGHLHAEIQYADKQKADAAEKAGLQAVNELKRTITEGREYLHDMVFGDGKPANIKDIPEAALSLYGLGALKHLEEIVDARPIKRNGNSFALSLTLPPHMKPLLNSAAISGAMFTPSIMKVQAAANRMRSSNNLKQIGLALHNYHDTVGHFPPAAILDENGKPLLSWRVAILPYIEQQNIVGAFKLDEPWDSKHNKELLKQMPKVYAIPHKTAKPGMTHYRGFVGNGAFWDWNQGRTLGSITDGTSNSWMLVEAEEGVPWTKPDDLEFDPLKELPKMGNFFKGGFNALMADGSVRFYYTLPKSVKAMITVAGGEIIADEE